MRSLGIDPLGKQGRPTLIFSELIAALGILAFIVMVLRQ